MLKKENIGNIDKTLAELEKRFLNINTKVEVIQNYILNDINRVLSLNCLSSEIKQNFNIEREELIKKLNFSYTKLLDIVNKHKTSTIDLNEIKQMIKTEKLEFNVYSCQSKDWNLFKIFYNNYFDASKKIKYFKFLNSLTSEINLRENFIDKNKISIEILTFDKCVLFYKDKNEMEIASNDFINKTVIHFKRKFKPSYFCNFKIWNSCIIIDFEPYVNDEPKFVCIFDEYFNIKACKKFNDLKSTLIRININEFIYWSSYLKKFIVLNSRLEKIESINYVSNINGPLVYLRNNFGYFLSNFNNSRISIYSINSGEINNKEENVIPISTLSIYKIFFDSNGKVFIYMLDPSTSFHKIFCYDSKGFILFCTEFSHYRDNILPNLVSDQIICFHDVHQRFISFI